MPRLRLALALMLFAATPAFAATPPPPDIAALAAREWTEVRTEHFHVLTDATPGAAFGAGRRLEQFVGLLHALHPSLRALPALPLDIIVLRDEAELRPFLAAGQENTAGFTVGGEGRYGFAINGEVEGTDRAAVVCHEYTHVFLNANFAQMPVWLNEGLAEFYETFRPRGRHAEYGHGQVWQPRWLAGHDAQSLDLLFAMKTQGAAYTGENELRQTTYAEGWAIVHWLYANPERAAKLDSVLARLRGGELPVIAFRSQFPQDTWPALVQDVKRYATGGLFDAHDLALAERQQLPDADSRTVPAAEALMRLGDLAAQVGPGCEPAAAALYDAALARDSSLAYAHVGRGWIADRAGDSTLAEASYARATALAPDDPRVALFAGLGTFERARRAERTNGTTRETLHALLVRARERFAACLRGDDGNPEALGGMGEAYLAEGQMPATAYHALALAVDALPARHDLLDALRYAHEIRERRADAGAPSGGAAADGATVTPGPPPSDAGRLEATALLKRAGDAWLAKRYDGAMALLTEARGHVADDSAATAMLDRQAAHWRYVFGLMHASSAIGANAFAPAADTLATLRALPLAESERANVERLAKQVAVRRRADHARTLLKAGDLKGARAEVVRAQALAEDDGMKRYLADLLVQIDRGLGK